MDSKFYESTSRDGEVYTVLKQPKWLTWFDSLSASELRAWLFAQGFKRNWHIGTHCLYFRDGNDVIVVDRAYDTPGFDWSIYNNRTRKFTLSGQRYATPEGAMRAAEAQAVKGIHL